MYGVNFNLVFKNAAQNLHDQFKRELIHNLFRPSQRFKGMIYRGDRETAATFNDMDYINNKLPDLKMFQASGDQYAEECFTTVFNIVYLT